MKTFVGINTLTSVEQIVYSNHLGFWYRLGKHYPNDDFILHTPRRMSIDRMRNISAKVALEAGCDYLLFIDDDVIVPINMFDKMVAADKDIIAGWTIIRGFPFKNMFFHFDEKKNLVTKDDVERNSGVIDVAAVGFSTCLIKCDLFKRIPPPWFVTGPTNTEDIYFCLKARQYIPDCSICVDTTIETAHIMGPEYIAPWNREDYATYFKTQNPDASENPMPLFLDSSGDRGSKYVEMVHGPLPNRQSPPEVHPLETQVIQEGM